MSALADIRKAVFAEFEAALAAAPNYSAIAIDAPNRRFQKPLNDPWVRVALNPGTRAPAALGSSGQKLNRFPFILALQVFVPENNGEKIAFEIADELLGPLEYQTAIGTVDGTRHNIHFETASIGTGFRAASDSDEGAASFWQLNATISGIANDWPA